MPDQTEGRPLLILPLPVEAHLAGSVMRAVADWWGDRYGGPLVVATDPDAAGAMREEHTEFGRALVLRAPTSEGSQR